MQIGERTQFRPSKMNLDEHGNPKSKMSRLTCASDSALLHPQADDSEEDVGTGVDGSPPAIAPAAATALDQLTISPTLKFEQICDSSAEAAVPTVVYNRPDVEGGGLEVPEPENVLNNIYGLLRTLHAQIQTVSTGLGGKLSSIQTALYLYNIISNHSIGSRINVNSG